MESLLPMDWVCSFSLSRVVFISLSVFSLFSGSGLPLASPNPITPPEKAVWPAYHVDSHVPHFHPRSFAYIITLQRSTWTELSWRRWFTLAIIPFFHLKFAKYCISHVTSVKGKAFSFFCRCVMSLCHPKLMDTLFNMALAPTALQNRPAK